MEKGINYEDLFIWQDKEVRFDVPRSQIALRNGEKVFDTIANIEDTKGNNGDVGTLIFSSLRLIWYCQSDIKLNLSIGFDCILNFEVRGASSKVTGETIGLVIKCKFNNNRFEFVFNAVSNNSPKLFSSFQMIHRAYDASRLYREIKLKGFLTQDKNLIMLPQEKVINKLSGVASVNNDQVIQGTYYLTNIRLVWYSNSLDNFNVSLPYMQIRGARWKELSKNGKVLCVETGKGSIGNTFHFKFPDKLDSMIKDLEDNSFRYYDNPIFGIEIAIENEKAREKANAGGNAQNANKTSSVINNSVSVNRNTTEVNSIVITNNTDTIQPQTQGNSLNLTSDNINNLDTFNRMLNSKEEIEIIETNYFNEQSNMLYYMTNNQEKKNAITDIVFSPELGLAVERLPENTTLESLWKIIL